VTDRGEVHVLVLGRDTLRLTEPASLLEDHRVVLSVSADPLAALLTFPDLAPDAVVVPVALPHVDVTSLVAVVSTLTDRPCFVSWSPDQGATAVVKACLTAGARGLLPPLVSVRELVTALQIGGAVPHHDPVVEIGQLCIDLPGLVVQRGGRRTRLTPAQASLLDALARGYPDPVERERLMASLDLTGRPHALTQAVTRLRRRLRSLGLDWDPVAFVDGGGYRLTPAPTESAEAG
jgi:DNA-binding response OmpR family regulator